MPEFGVVDEVKTVNDGDFLTADLTIGTTVLPVDNTDIFETETLTGTVQVNGEVHAYTSVDPTNSTITLASGLVAAASLNDSVYVYPLAPVKYAYVTLTGGEGDSLSVRVPHYLTAYMSLVDGPREPGQGESVTVDDVAGELVLIDVLGIPPVLDGSFLDPSTLPMPAPTAAPVDAPILTLSPFAVGSVVATWTEVDDAQWYNIYASTTTGFDSSDPANLAVEHVIGLRGLVSAIAGVQIPVDGSPVYVVVKAANIIGEGPASNEASAIARQADQEFLSALYAYFGTVEAQNAMFGTLDVLVSISTDGAINVGPRITIETPNTTDGTGGITIWGDDAHTIVLVRLHPNGSYFDGTITAEDITVIESLRLLGNASALASGATLFLENGISDPAKPTLTAGAIKSSWPAVPAGYTQKGVCWDAANSQWIRLLQNNSSNRGFMQTVSTAGVAGTNTILGHDNLVNTGGRGGAVKVSGITALGSNLYYVLEVIPNTAPSEAYLVKCAISTGASSSSTTVVSGDPGLGNDDLLDEWAVGNDGTNIYTVTAGDQATFYPSNGVFVQKFSTALAHLGETKLTGASTTAIRRFVAVTDLGYGAAKITVASGTSVDVYPLGTFSGDAVAKDTTLSWALDLTLAAGGIAYKTSGSDQGFYSTHNDQKLSRWSSYYPAASEKWYAKYTDVAASGISTAPSPISSGLTVPARRFVTVALNALPAGVTDSHVYVGYGSSAPADTALFKRVSPEAIASRSMTLVSGKISTGNPLQFTVTNRQLTSNVAKLTIGSHSMVVGQKVTVTGVPTDTFFNGTFILTAVTSTTISYAVTHADVTSTASTGSVSRGNGLGGTPSKVYDGLGNQWTGDGVVDLPGLKQLKRFNSGVIPIADFGTGTTFTTGSIAHGCDGVPAIDPSIGPHTNTSPIFGPPIVKSVDATNFVLILQKADGSAFANQGPRNISWQAMVPQP